MKPVHLPASTLTSQDLIYQVLTQFWGDKIDCEETARRVLGYWTEFNQQTGDLSDIFKTFECDNDEMVIQKDIPFQSMCEHHLLPFSGVAHLGYIPYKSVIGLSKMGRLVDYFSKRPQMQERLTKQIGESLDQNLSPLGVICILEGEHTCLSSRGVLKGGSTTKTSYLTGVFKIDINARQEALKLIYG